MQINEAGNGSAVVPGLDVNMRPDIVSIVLVLRQIAWIVPCHPQEGNSTNERKSYASHRRRQKSFCSSCSTGHRIHAGEGPREKLLRLEYAISGRLCTGTGDPSRRNHSKKMRTCAYWIAGP